MSFLLDAKMAKEAVELVLPAILKMMDGGAAKRRALHIVIMDPIEGNLFEYRVGNPKEWEKPYDEFARRKAALACAQKMDTAAVVTLRPHLMIQDDCKYPGGVFFEGIPVGVSGVQAYFDEMFARWVAAACVALSKQAMESIQADPGRHLL